MPLWPSAGTKQAEKIEEIRSRREWLLRHLSETTVYSRVDLEGASDALTSLFLPLVVKRAQLFHHSLEDEIATVKEALAEVLGVDP